jgi:AcrR family transcriptional regulator
MPRRKDPVGPIINAAMQLAALGGWRNVTLYDIARESGLEVAEVVAAVGSRSGIIAAIAERADTAMLSAIDDDWPDEAVRDRLFTLLIARFDHLKPHREGLRAVLASLPADPMGALTLMAGPGQRSMRLALESAGVSTAGLGGALRMKALGLAYARTFRSFLDDDSDDLSKTMAALDKALAGLDRLAGRFRRGRSPFSDNGAADAAPEAEATAG